MNDLVFVSESLDGFHSIQTEEIPEALLRASQGRLYRPSRPVGGRGWVAVWFSPSIEGDQKK